MNIGIVGYKGFVGNAMLESMKEYFQIYGYDKNGGLVNIEKNLNSTISEHVQGAYTDEQSVYNYFVGFLEGPVFVCVPTPMNQDGSCNTDIVESVVANIDLASTQQNKKTVVVVKSTVVPGTCERLSKKYTNCYICFNPEFLTEKNAVQDFKNQNRIIIGGPQEGIDVVKEVYQASFPNVPIMLTNSTSAEMVKYVTNCFLATKVSFANEIYQICDKLNINYSDMIELAKLDKRLGESHWQVPGPMPSSDGSGKLLPGYSGSCFCKDINALISMSSELGVDPKVMKAGWEKNLEVRPEKDWEKLLGRAVAKND
jgi:nucleotide sugar dehydrogenase